jgi:hypothetical protein
MRINKSLVTNQVTGAGTGSVTSVAMTVPTGLTITGSPISSSGTLALGFASGVALPPSQTGNSGKYLTTDGTNMSWGNISGSISGTANYVPFFATSSTLGTSPLYYDGSYYMAIGTTTTGTGRFLVYNTLADTHLQISGTTPSIRITDTPTSATYNTVIGLAISANAFITNTVAGDLAIDNATNGSILFGISGTEALRIFTTTRNVSIGGTSTDAGWKFDVIGGDARINGVRVGRGNANGSQDVAVGRNALLNNTIDGASTAIGYAALTSQSSGYRNTGIGASAGANVTTGIQNTFVGGRAGAGVTTGSNNIHIGYAGGAIGLTTGSYNVLIGTISGLSSTLANNIIIADGQGTQRINVNSSGSVGFGTGTTINASAKLELISTTQGFLLPRMTNAQRTAISSPAVGLIVYCTDSTEGLYVYKSGGWTFII